MTHPATLLKNSWRAYARDFRAWLILTAPLAALAALSIFVALMFQGQPIASQDSALWMRIAVLVGFFTAFVIIIIIARIFTTAVIVSSYRSLNGQKLNIKESIRVGWKTFAPIIWVAILRGLIVLGGLILFIVPGIIWALRYSLAVQAAVIEGKRGMGALHRSKDLTRGKLLETLVNFGVVGIILGYGVWIVLLAVMAVFIVLGAMVMLAVPMSASTAVSGVVAAITVVAEIIMVWLIKPLSPLAVTSIYKDFSDK
jgi:hypothetical protein